MKKMYIAVLDEVPDYMVPTLVAHSVINAHMHFADIDKLGTDEFDDYQDWLENSFKKVTLRVNRKEFTKISELPVWLGHENTTLDAEKSCAVVLPMDDDARPNVLKFAKMWKPVDG
jgi:hypothetical protein